MERDQIFRSISVWMITLIFAFFTKAGFASFTKDPVEETQTKPVPVTQELLTREGEPGPASPTYKVQDTAKFLVKKPYDQAEKGNLDDLSEDEETSSISDEWFFWDEEEESVLDPEPIDKK